MSSKTITSRSRFEWAKTRSRNLTFEHKFVFTACVDMFKIKKIVSTGYRDLIRSHSGHGYCLSKIWTFRICHRSISRHLLHHSCAWGWLQQLVYCRLPSRNDYYRITHWSHCIHHLKRRDMCVNWTRKQFFYLGSLETLLSDSQIGKRKARASQSARELRK